jgi:hypothetical protein
VLGKRAGGGRSGRPASGSCSGAALRELELETEEPLRGVTGPRLLAGVLVVGGRRHGASR